MTVQALISLLKDTETVFINVVESARLFICCGLSKAAKNEVVDGVEYLIVLELICSAIYTAIENLIDHCKVSYKEVFNVYLSISYRSVVSYLLL